jgi:hypothetical protein
LTCLTFRMAVTFFGSSPVYLDEADGARER